MVGMDEVHKIPPEKADALARDLRGALQQRRPHTRWIVVASIAVALAGLGLLAWWLYTPTDPVRLEVIAFDDVAAPDEFPKLRAQLAFPDDDEHSPALLRGRDVVFLEASGTALLLPGQQGMQKSVTSDAQGRALAEWQPPRGKIDAIAVRYVDVRYKQGSTDHASLFRWERGGKILLVDVQETLAQLAPAQWETTPLDKILPRLHAVAALQEAERRNFQVGYVVLSSRPLTYRMVRGWVHAPKTEKERFPPGPVFGQFAEPAVPAKISARQELVEFLSAGFGGTIVYIAADADAADLGRVAGVRVLMLGEGEAVAGVQRAADWSKVIPLLNP
jgi:hypothetical protein